MRELEEIIELLGKAGITGLKLGGMGKGTAISSDQVLAVAPEGFWEEKQGVEGYVEVNVADFYPKLFEYGEEVPRSELYLEYELPSPIYDPVNKVMVQEFGYKAILVLASMYALKKLFGEARLYLCLKDPKPLVVKPSPLGTSRRGLECIIAPRISPMK